MNSFNFALPDATIVHLEATEIDPTQHQIRLTVRTFGVSCSCPGCQCLSHRIHSHYQRQLADLPWSDYQVLLQLQTRKFFCDNPACQRKIFTERFASVALPWARCTVRLNRQLSQIGLIVGGQAGARLSQHCHSPRSRNTFLRRAKRSPLPIFTMPKIVGIDDFAFRKGQTYGTIIVDLDQHRPIALLPDREASTVADWLRAHPGIEVLSRDRSKTYKQAMDTAAPDAIQVADRFHLLHNLAEVLESCLSAQTPALRTVEAAYYGTVTIPDPPELSPSPRQQQRQLRREQRLQNYTQVHQLRAKGWAILAIAQELSIGERTVYTYLRQPVFQERQPHARKGSQPLIAPYGAYLAQRWAEGVRQGKQLFQEIQQQGYKGGYASVMRYLQPLQGTQPSSLTGSPVNQVRKLLKQKPLTARRAAWLVMKRDANRTDIERALLAGMLQQLELADILRLSQSFLELVRERQPTQLDDWLTAATDSEIPQFQRFVTGLRSDYDAVRAALTLDVSNGPVEGLNNRLKMLKRQMYGRAGLDLLTHRFLLSA
jgi:transposase